MLITAADINADSSDVSSSAHQLQGDRSCSLEQLCQVALDQQTGVDSQLIERPLIYVVSSGNLNDVNHSVSVKSEISSFDSNLLYDTFQRPSRKDNMNVIPSSECVSPLQILTSPSSPNADHRGAPFPQMDEGYWIKRKKNNEAAKRSREKRRNNDAALEARVSQLQQINAKLAEDNENLKTALEQSHKRIESLENDHKEVSRNRLMSEIHNKLSNATQAPLIYTCLPPNHHQQTLSVPNSKEFQTKTSNFPQRMESQTLPPAASVLTVQQPATNQILVPFQPFHGLGGSSNAMVHSQLSGQYVYVNTPINATVVQAVSSGQIQPMPVHMNQSQSSLSASRLITQVIPPAPIIQTPALQPVDSMIPLKKRFKGY